MVLMAVLICERCSMPFDRRSGTTRLCSAYCRFMAKVVVDPDTGCWEWTASRRSGGYGQFGAVYGESPVFAHRWSYENVGGGELIPGMQIDHLCRNPPCVNPKHLEQVTPLENFARSGNKGAVAVRTGVCHRGHSMDDALTKADGISRYCRSCANEDRRNRYAKQVGRPVRKWTRQPEVMC